MLEAYNALHNYDIICISETYLNSSLSKNDPTLNFKVMIVIVIVIVIYLFPPINLHTTLHSV